MDIFKCMGISRYLIHAYFPLRIPLRLFKTHVIVKSINNFDNNIL